jgi:hypothetical protein
MISRTPVACAALLLLCACAQAPVPVDSGAAPSSLPQESSSSVIAIAPRLPLEKRSVRYQKEGLGYSFLLPTYLVPFTRCEKQLFPQGLKLTTFDEGNDLFVAPAQSVTQTGSAARTVCGSATVTMADVHAGMMGDLWYYNGWKMVKKTGIGTDAQLLSFIRRWYGPGCGILEKTATSQAGTYDVHIAGDTTDDKAEGSRCPLNFLYALKYSPARKTAVTWKVGQDGRFDDLDHDMIDSFRFE